MTTHAQWIGVDVSKKMLDVFSPNLGAFRVANTAQGFEALVTKIANMAVAGVVMEATGGYEQALLKSLTARGINASIVNPARVRAFATGAGQLAKTDKIDAQILVHYAAFKKPAPTPLASTARAKLKEYWPIVRKSSPRSRHARRNSVIMRAQTLPPGQTPPSPR